MFGKGDAWKAVKEKYSPAVVQIGTLCVTSSNFLAYAFKYVYVCLYTLYTLYQLVNFLFDPSIIEPNCD